MRVKVESCWGGHRLYHRLTLPDGKRLILGREEWNRSAAKDALDLIGVERPSVPRHTIRFDVH